ncbi:MULTISPECIES: C39 family peptidase [unclassified Microcoleus]|uniref:C39 family peptidase n=1 Tax=unclassified Microcoleus TaxID=2642155 RepID=UPI002FCEB207
MPDKARLEIEYKSQLDNLLNPTGACNVTAIATCLNYFGIKSRSLAQLEDEIYRAMENLGLNRHSPDDLAEMVRRYGLKNDFTLEGTFDRCKRHLAAGNPCVIHGYFTSFGHIVTLVGYDNAGFLVHDPYGEWFSTGYDISASGAYLHYSYDLIRRTCANDGQFWVHYISQ